MCLCLKLRTDLLGPWSRLPRPSLPRSGFRSRIVAFSRPLKSQLRCLRLESAGRRCKPGRQRLSAWYAWARTSSYGPIELRIPVLLVSYGVLCSVKQECNCWSTSYTAARRSKCGKVREFQHGPRQNCNDRSLVQTVQYKQRGEPGLKQGGGSRCPPARVK